MMKDNLPKLLKDCIDQNTYDVDIITKKLKLPWLKLDVGLPTPTDDDVLHLKSNTSWREQWHRENLDKISYQVQNWNGKIFFGPTDFKEFLDLTKKDANENDHDEDSKCRKYRNQLNYEWYNGTSDYLRSLVHKLIPNDRDLNLVNTYHIPPGGYVFPHRDYAIDGMGLAKIYVALKWGKGNVFGMYGCGNIPIEEGDVLLLNNYTLPHWVYNGSDQDRVVIDISANLNAPIIKAKIIESFKKTFGS